MNKLRCKNTKASQYVYWDALFYLFETDKAYS